MAKKNKAGKVLLASLGILLAGGVAATITAGALTGWTFGVNDPFSEVKIESTEVDYDGTAKKLDISLPEGASYELKTKKVKLFLKLKKLAYMNSFIKLQLKVKQESLKQN